MQGFCELLVFFILCFARANGSTIHQISSVLANETGDVTIQCSHDNTNLQTMLWYQKNTSTVMALIGYTYGATGSPNFEDEFNDRFKLSRQSVTEGSLTIGKLLQSDSAVYYCAAKDISEAYFGAGTKLTILEPGHEITKPTVRVLNVSPNELCVKENVTLVCVAEGFYPDHVDVYWTVGDENRTSDVSTDQAATRKGKFYSISSRLNINYKDEWTKGHKFTCTVQFFDGKAYSDHSHSIDGPNLKDNDVEGHVRSVNTMLMAYGMFIAKSIAYGLFILYIIKRQGFMSK